MGTALVTGAASGIGRALARQLAAEGHTVHLVDISPLQEVAAETRGVPATADVADPDEVDRLARGLPGLDLVCLNAGIVGTSMGPPWEAPPAEWRRLIDVNLLGVVNGLRSFVPVLLGRDGPAHLLITASLAGVLTFPGGGAYAASKHAVVAVAEQAALALSDTSVTVTLLCPALVRSGMSEVGANPADVAAEALAAARAGRFLVLPDEWRAAAVRRTERLLSGDVPELPTPHAHPDARPPG